MQTLTTQAFGTDIEFVLFDDDNEGGAAWDAQQITTVFNADARAIGRGTFQTEDGYIIFATHWALAKKVAAMLKSRGIAPHPFGDEN